MGYPKLQDDDENEIEILREIRDAVRGIGGDNVSSATSVRVHEVSGNFAPPQETIRVANQEWLDHRLSSITLEDLAPGDTQTVVSIETEQSNTFVSVRGVATTRHAYDLNGDGEKQSAIEYVHEFTTHDSDGWLEFPGVGGTLPLGSLGDPVELLPGAYIGPISGYRIRFKNRSSGMSNEVTINAEKMGAEIAGLAITGDEE